MAIQHASGFCYIIKLLLYYKKGGKSDCHSQTSLILPDIFSGYSSSSCSA